VVGGLYLCITFNNKKTTIMATRSRIAVLQKDGTVKSIYCHFDGYLSGVGAELLHHYNDYEKANALMALGNLSSVGEHLQPNPASPHNFECSQKGVTSAYHRDRGEDFDQDTHKDLPDYLENGDFEEYNYLFVGGKWYLLEGVNVTELTPELVESK
jgi:hypothetical protein